MCAVRGSSRLAVLFLLLLVVHENGDEMLMHSSFAIHKFVFLLNSFEKDLFVWITRSFYCLLTF